MRRILRGITLFMAFCAFLGMNVRAAENEVLTEDGVYAASRSAAFGTLLTCRAAVTAEELRSGGTLHGALSSTLRFVSLRRLTRSGEPINSAYYTLAAGERADGCAFEIHFSSAFCEELSPDDRIEAEYTVCVLGGECSECRVYAWREGKSAEVHSFSLSLYRGVCAVGENDRRHPLNGALYQMWDGEGTRLRFFREADGTYSVCAAPECAHGHHVSILRTPENGMLSLRGLAAGTYVLEEKRPPAGFTAAKESLEIEIGEDGAWTAADTPREGETLLLLNHNPAILPTARPEDSVLRFYAAGCRVLLAAAALIVTERTLLRKYE